MGLLWSIWIYLLPSLPIILCQFNKNTCDVVGMSISSGSEGISATSDPDPEARDTIESEKKNQKHFLTLCKFKLCLNRCPDHNLNDITYIENFNK